MAYLDYFNQKNYQTFGEYWNPGALYIIHANKIFDSIRNYKS